MSAIVTFAQLLSDCELRIERAEESQPAIERALTYGCGMAHGYFLAGGISEPEFAGACARMSEAANQRLRMRAVCMGEAA